MGIDSERVPLSELSTRDLAGMYRHDDYFSDDMPKIIGALNGDIGKISEDDLSTCSKILLEEGRIAGMLSKDVYSEEINTDISRSGHGEMVKKSQSNVPVISELRLRIKAEQGKRREVRSASEKNAALAPYRAEYEKLDEVGQLRETVRVYRDMRALESARTKLRGKYDDTGNIDKALELQIDEKDEALSKLERSLLVLEDLAQKRIQ
jgi:hypothetical protein